MTNNAAEYAQSWIRKAKEASRRGKGDYIIKNKKTLILVIVLLIISLDRGFFWPLFGCKYFILLDAKFLLLF